MAGDLKKAKLKLKLKGYGDVECSEYHHSIVLHGRMDSWADIVAAGKAATGCGYKGVVNDIELNGFEAPDMRVPDFTDNELEGRTPDVLIIGGGVIGCSIARELSKWDLDIVLCEKESDVAMQASSRNDGMIHPGIASHCGTLRGLYNVRGNAMYTQLCKDLDIPFERYGNFILYADKAFEKAAYPVFMMRAKKLGIEKYSEELGIEHWAKLSKDEIKKLEPHITDEAIGAFSFPNSGVLSPYKLTAALADSAVENGVHISLNTAVSGMKKQGDRIISVKTTRGTVHPALVINAAGCFADTVAGMADDRFFSLHPRKGEIAILDKKKGGDVQRSLGLVRINQAFSTSKGGGVMRTIDNNVLVGPDAYEQPLREDFSTHKDNIDSILKKHLKLIDTFRPSDVITYFGGVRACNYEEEFIVERSEYVPNLVHAAAIQSPGLASAPAIAEKIAEISVAALSETKQVHRNDKFDPVRKRTPHMARLSFEEKQKVIENNPDYGIIICRCEEISKGEIIDAVNGPVRATSIDAIKRRVRPGMGRCQGGFCSPLVTQIICEQTGLQPEMVTKSGGESQLLYGKTPKGGDAQ